MLVEVEWDDNHRSQADRLDQSLQALARRIPLPSDARRRGVGRGLGRSPETGSHDESKGYWGNPNSLPVAAVARSGPTFMPATRRIGSPAAKSLASATRLRSHRPVPDSDVATGVDVPALARNPRRNPITIVLELSRRSTVGAVNSSVFRCQQAPIVFSRSPYSAARTRVLAGLMNACDGRAD